MNKYNRNGAVMRTLHFCLIVIVLCAAGLQIARAQIPNTISYQGVLTDPSGTPVMDGSYTMSFKLYDAPTTPAALWSETQVVAVREGVFNVELGSVEALNLPFDNRYYIGISIDGASEMLPRTALSAVPYAMVSEKADVAAGLVAGATGVVTSVNSIQGDVTLEGAGSTTITRTGNKVTISSTGGTGGTGIQGVQNSDGTMTVDNPTGPVATLGLADGGITTAKLQDASITASKLAQWSVTADKIGFDAVVKSLEVNGTQLHEDIVFAAGNNVTLNSSGNTVTISATGGTGGTGIQGVQNTNGTLDIINGSGPVATINIAANGIREAHLADDAVTTAKIADGSIKTAHLTNEAVTTAKISGTGANTGQVLSYDGAQVVWTSPSQSGVGGSGATNQLALWNSTSTLAGDAQLVFAGSKLGIGITSPGATLHVSGNEGLLAEGTYNTGSAQNLGPGTRLHWYPRKAAFRVGATDGTNWDDANVGSYSIATGHLNIASGDGSTAMGILSIASGYRSTALGSARAVGDYSTALGNGIANGRFGTAMGAGTKANGTGSTAMGGETTASGDYSTAMGYDAMASGDYSTAIGFDATASSSYSTAIGRNTTASGSSSTAMGNYVSTGGRSGSFIIGDNSTTTVHTSSRNDRFTARFANGYYLYTNSSLTTGVRMSGNANSWSTVSDSTKKERFRDVDGELILEKFSTLRLGSWNYTGQDPAQYRHYGPMAQEWFAAFGHDDIGIVGDDTTLATADVDGILCIAIQALEARTAELRNVSADLKAKDEELREMRLRMSAQEDKMAALRMQMEAILARMANVETAVATNSETGQAAPAPKQASVLEIRK